MQININAFNNAAPKTFPQYPLFDSKAARAGRYYRDPAGNVCLCSLDYDDRRTVYKAVRRYAGCPNGGRDIYSAINRHFGVRHYWELTPDKVPAVLQMIDEFGTNRYNGETAAEIPVKDEKPAGADNMSDGELLAMGLKELAEQVADIQNTLKIFAVLAVKTL